MDASRFYTLLKHDFPHETTTNQDIALQLLARFSVEKNENQIFLLKGYAGTGKTTIVGTLGKKLMEIKKIFCFIGSHRACS